MVFLTWVFTGVVCGIVGGLAVSRGSQRKFGPDIFVACVGAFAGGILLAPVFEIQIVNQISSSFPTLLIGLAGAVLLLTVYYSIRFLRLRSA